MTWRGKAKRRPTGHPTSPGLVGPSERTHLIDDIEGCGIWEDDYERFIEHRGERVLEELKKRLEPELD